LRHENGEFSHPTSVVENPEASRGSLQLLGDEVKKEPLIEPVYRTSLMRWLAVFPIILLPRNDFFESILCMLRVENVVTLPLARRARRTTIMK
jgi:hypothetical protein